MKLSRPQTLLILAAALAAAATGTVFSSERTAARGAIASVAHNRSAQTPADSTSHTARADVQSPKPQPAVTTGPHSPPTGLEPTADNERARHRVDNLIDLLTTRPETVTGVQCILSDSFNPNGVATTTDGFGHALDIILQQHQGGIRSTRRQLASTRRNELAALHAQGRLQRADFSIDTLSENDRRRVNARIAALHARESERALQTGKTPRDLSAEERALIQDTGMRAIPASQRYRDGTGQAWIGDPDDLSQTRVIRSEWESQVERLVDALANAFETENAINTREADATRQAVRIRLAATR